MNFTYQIQNYYYRNIRFHQSKNSNYIDMFSTTKIIFIQFNTYETKSDY